MKLKHKLISTALAFTMLLSSAVLPELTGVDIPDLLSVKASAASGNSGSNITVKPHDAVNGYGNATSNHMLYRVYLMSKDIYDGSGMNNIETTNSEYEAVKAAVIASNNGDSAWKSDSWWIFPDGNFSCTWDIYTSMSGGPGLRFNTIQSSDANVVSLSSLGSAWQGIFANVPSNCYLNGATAENYLGRTLNANYKAYRQSTNGSYEQEYNDIIAPLLATATQEVRTEIANRKANNEALTLGIELYTPLEEVDGGVVTNVHYMSQPAIIQLVDSAYWKTSATDSTAIGYGMQVWCNRNRKTQFTKAFVPAFAADYVNVTGFKPFSGVDAYGWSYYSFCNPNNVSEGEPDLEIVKEMVLYEPEEDPDFVPDGYANFDALYDDWVSPDGAIQVKSSYRTSGLIYANSIDSDINSTMSAEDVLDKVLDKLGTDDPTAITAPNFINAFTELFTADPNLPLGTLIGGNKPGNTDVRLTKKDFVTIPAVDATEDPSRQKKAVFFVFAETELTNNADIRNEAHTLPIGIVKYDIASETWTVAPLESGRLKIGSGSGSSKVQIIVDNEWDLYADERNKAPDVTQSTLAEAILVDTDHYFMTNVPTDLNYTAVQQTYDTSGETSPKNITANSTHLYTNTTIISGDKETSTSSAVTNGTPVYANQLINYLDEAQSADITKLEAPVANTTFDIYSGYNNAFDVRGKFLTGATTEAKSYSGETKTDTHSSTLGMSATMIKKYERNVSLGSLFEGEGSSRSLVAFDDYFTKTFNGSDVTVPGVDTASITLVAGTGTETTSVSFGDTTKMSKAEVAAIFNTYGKYAETYATYEAAVAQSGNEAAILMSRMTEEAKKIYDNVKGKVTGWSASCSGTPTQTQVQHVSVSIQTSTTSGLGYKGHGTKTTCTVNKQYAGAQHYDGGSMAAITNENLQQALDYVESLNIKEDILYFEALTGWVLGLRIPYYEVHGTDCCTFRSVAVVAGADTSCTGPVDDDGNCEDSSVDFCCVAIGWCTGMGGGGVSVAGAGTDPAADEGDENMGDTGEGTQKTVTSEENHDYENQTGNGTSGSSGSTPTPPETTTESGNGWWSSETHAGSDGEGGQSGEGEEGGEYGDYTGSLDDAIEQAMGGGGGGGAGAGGAIYNGYEYVVRDAWLDGYKDYMPSYDDEYSGGGSTPLNTQGECGVGYLPGADETVLKNAGMPYIGDNIGAAGVIALNSSSYAGISANEIQTGLQTIAENSWVDTKEDLGDVSDYWDMKDCTFSFTLDWNYGAKGADKIYGSKIEIDADSLIGMYYIYSHDSNAIGNFSRWLDDNDHRYSNASKYSHMSPDDLDKALDNEAWSIISSKANAQANALRGAIIALPNSADISWDAYASSLFNKIRGEMGTTYSENKTLIALEKFLPLKDIFYTATKEVDDSGSSGSSYGGYGFGGSSYGGYGYGGYGYGGSSSSTTTYKYTYELKMTSAPTWDEYTAACGSRLSSSTVEDLIKHLYKQRLKVDLDLQAVYAPIGRSYTSSSGYYGSGTLTGVQAWGSYISDYRARNGMSSGGSDGAVTTGQIMSELNQLLNEVRAEAERTGSGIKMPTTSKLASNRYLPTASTRSAYSYLMTLKPKVVGQKDTGDARGRRSFDFDYEETGLYTKDMEAEMYHDGTSNARNRDYEYEERDRVKYVGGYIGQCYKRMCEIAQELAVLEANRPYAEFDLTQYYTTQYNPDWFKTVDVDPYMLTMYWQKSDFFNPLNGESDLKKLINHEIKYSAVKPKVFSILDWEGAAPVINTSMFKELDNTKGMYAAQSWENPADVELATDAFENFCAKQIYVWQRSGSSPYLSESVIGAAALNWAVEQKRDIRWAYLSLPTKSLESDGAKKVVTGLTTAYDKFALRTDATQDKIGTDDASKVSDNNATVTNLTANTSKNGTFLVYPGSVLTQRTPTGGGAYIAAMGNAADKNKNYDLYSIINPSFRSYTSIWRVDSTNPTKTYLPDNEYLQALADLQFESEDSDYFLEAYTGTLALLADKGAEAQQSTTHNVGATPTAYKSKATDYVSTYAKNPYVMGLTEIGIAEVTGSANVNYITLGGFQCLAADAVNQPDSGLLYFKKPTMATTGRNAETVAIFDKAYTSTTYGKWYASDVPYTMIAQFTKLDARGTDLTAADLPDANSEVITDTPTDGSELAKGTFIRGDDWKIYPLVRMGWYASANDAVPTPHYAFALANKAYTVPSSVYYAMGFVGTAQPVIMASDIVTDSRADEYLTSKAIMSETLDGTIALNSELPAETRAQVAYSGTDITISYADSDLLFAVESFNLVNTDYEKAYQTNWGNKLETKTINGETSKDAQSDILLSMGAKHVTVDGTNVWAMPYMAKVNLGIANPEATSTNYSTNKWQASQNGIQAAYEYTTDMSWAGDLTLSIEKGQLTRLTIPAGATIAVLDTNSINGKSSTNLTRTNNAALGESNYDTNNTVYFKFSADKHYTGDTKSIINALKNDNLYSVANALVAMNITGENTDLLHTAFVTGYDKATTAGGGSDSVEPYNDVTFKGIANVQASGRTEATYDQTIRCLALRYECTTFKPSNLVFNEKIPIDYGPKTPANRDEYYKHGYGLIAEKLMFQIGQVQEANAAVKTGYAANGITGNLSTGVAAILGTKWSIGRFKDINDSTDTYNTLGITGVNTQGVGTIEKNRFADLIITNVSVNNAY